MLRSSTDTFPPMQVSDMSRRRPPSPDDPPRSSAICERTLQKDLRGGGRKTHERSLRGPQVLERRGEVSIEEVLAQVQPSQTSSARCQLTLPVRACSWVDQRSYLLTSARSGRDPEKRLFRRLRYLKQRQGEMGKTAKLYLNDGISNNCCGRSPDMVKVMNERQKEVDQT
eukprot:768058-Hanusia_phi.AAC.9